MRSADERCVPRSHHPSIRTRISQVSRGNAAIIDALEGLIAVLAEDPHNRSGKHPIKKLAGLKPGEGQWRIRWRDHRLRYDIFDDEVVLHSFRHRKKAYSRRRVRGSSKRVPWLFGQYRMGNRWPS